MKLQTLAHFQSHLGKKIILFRFLRSGGRQKNNIASAEKGTFTNSTKEKRIDHGKKCISRKNHSSKRTKNRSAQPDRKTGHGPEFGRDAQLTTRKRREEKKDRQFSRDKSCVHFSRVTELAYPGEISLSEEKNAFPSSDRSKVETPLFISISRSPSYLNWPLEIFLARSRMCRKWLQTERGIEVAKSRPGSNVDKLTRISESLKLGWKWQTSSAKVSPNTPGRNLANLDEF